MSAIDIQQLGLDAWGSAQMAKPENFNLVASLVDDFSLTLNPGDSYALYLVLDDLLKKYGASLAPKILTNYEVLHKKLGILSWLNMPDLAVKSYLTNNLLFIFKNQLPLLGLIAAQLRWDKDNFFNILANYRGYLRENTETIGQAGLPYNFSVKDNNPTVKNWLNDFIISSGSPKELDTLSFIKYFNENLNVKLLKKEENILLKKILKLYTILTSPLKNSAFYQEPYLFDDFFETDLTLTPVNSPVFSQSAVIKPTANDLAQIADLYQTNLTALQGKYQINQGILTYKDYQLNQLKDLLLAEMKNPKTALPVLMVIVAKEGGLKLLEAELPTLLVVGENSKNKLKEAIGKLLLGAGLTQGEAAVYLMHLAKSNNHLAGWAYADLKDLTFKLRN
ncbi:MAG: hypothetical protein NTZ18_02560 [Candidatus Komeilibacteria bacterium]|nr:hypothetical protein [Candidatus Komeilibacteria bacterium]